MKILKESRETLPLTFVTSFVAEAWEKVGYLKAEIEAINAEFEGTTAAVEAIQQLIDAYLISIGKMEQYLAAQRTIVAPTENVEEPAIESLKEDVTINIGTVEINDPKIKVKNKEISSCEETHEPDCEELPVEEPTAEEIMAEEPPAAEIVKADTDEPATETDKLAEVAECIKKESFTEAFEYFIDEFPEPVKETHLDD